MPWVRLDDHYFTHRKTAGLSKDAKLLDLAGMTFSAGELRDGVLTDKDIRIIAAQVDVEHLKDCLHELELAGRWRHTPDGWEIHDYLDYNPSRAQVLRDREAGAERVRNFRSKRNAVTEGVTNGVSPGSPGPGSFNPGSGSGSGSGPGSRAAARAREADPSRFCSACREPLRRRRARHDHGLCSDCHGRALVAAKARSIDVTHINLVDLVGLAVQARAST
jgi:hypothetical protein